MRILLQRVSRARVTVAGRTIGEISDGAVAFVGVAKEDTVAAAASLAEKTAHLRIFPDAPSPQAQSQAQSKMNRSLLDTGGAALVVSQFTLYGDTRHGRRPSFDRAAPLEKANALYQEYIRCLAALGVRVETGAFQAHMEVELVNDGPVTILIDSEPARENFPNKSLNKSIE